MLASKPCQIQEVTRTQYELTGIQIYGAEKCLYQPQISLALVPARHQYSNQLAFFGIARSELLQ